MIEVRDQRVEQIFSTLLAGDVGEREQLLRRQCAGNEPLERHVRALLRCCQQTLCEPSIPIQSTLAFNPPGTSADDTASTVKDDSPSPPITAAFPPNVTATFGDYEILGPLGRGGMGIVYKARHRKLERLVALKMIVAGQLARREDVERFYTEARAAAALDHPGIVPVYEVGEQDGRHFYAMALVEGKSLAATLADGPLIPEEAARVVEHVSRAAHYAHQRGVVHRDLKPSNVMLSASGERQLPESAPLRSTTPSRAPSHNQEADALRSPAVKILDFGLAKMVASDSSLTMTGQIMGTPSYMAPEQAKGAEIDARADVYALGSVLYACLTGRPPFEAASPAETLRQVLDQEPVSPRQLNAAIPLDLDTICLKCLEKDPSRRYATAGDVADELERFLAGKPILVRPVGRFERLRRWSRRHPREATLGAALISLLVLAAVGSTTAALLINDARADEVIARTAESKAKQDAIGARDRAQKNEQAARTAEQKANALLAESSAQTARLAAQRGQWAIALENLNRALERGHSDPIGVRLARVEAYSAMNDIAHDRAEIEALANEKNAGKYRGAILLWQGDLAMPRGQQERAVELIKQAQAAGLGAADAAYAQGLLAETTPEAIAHFQQALVHDPFHHRALMWLTQLLLLSGRHDEARERLTTAELLFPDDVNFLVMQAVSDAIHGRREEALARIERGRDRLGDITLYQSMLEALHEIASLPEHWDGASDEWNQAQLFRRAFQAQRLLVGKQGEDASLVSLSALPCLKQSLGKAQQAVLTLINPLALRREEKAAALFDQACASHPEGTMYFLQANTLVAEGEWEQAERPALLAARTPSFVPGMNREAFYMAAFAQAAQATLQGKTEKIPLALENVRERLQLGPVRPLHAYYMWKIAKYGEDWPLARELSDMILRDRPGEAEPLVDRANLELKAGAYQAAIEYADRAMALEPELATAREARLQAVEKLKSFLADAPPES